MRPRVLFTALCALGMIDFGLLESIDVPNITVDELAAHAACYTGCPISIRGELAHGTLEKRSQGAECEHRFALEHEGKRVTVVHGSCIEPDTFVDDGRPLPLRVDGSLQPDGTIRAAMVLVLRPCRYFRADRD